MSELASLLHVLSTPLGDLLSFAGGGDVKTDELGFVFGALIVLGLAVVVASLLAGGVRGEEGVEERGEAMLAALVAPMSFLIGDVLTARLERGVDGSETAKVGIKLGVGTSAAPRLFCLPRTSPRCLDRKDVSSAIVTHRSEIASPNCSLDPNLLRSQVDCQVQVHISKLGGKVMEVMEVMNWEVMNSCSNGSNEEVIALQNDHVVMKMAHGVMM
jgi:hypothetical protein